jgi:hypothetical protein
VLQRLFWHNPFNRKSSVLHAINLARLPLSPPDADVEECFPGDERERYANIHESNYSMAFLSHTRKDEPLIRTRVLPFVEPYFAEVFLLNIGMAFETEQGASIVTAYKRRILSALSIASWVIVVVSSNAASSQWVRFEFGWALRFHDHRRIIALIVDEAGRRSFLPVLRFIRCVPLRSGRSTEFAIESALRRTGAIREPHPK